MASVEREAADYHTRVHDDPRDIDAAEWNALLARQPEPTLFMRHEYVCALHTSGSAVPRTGWQPHFITLTQSGRLMAAAALYLKSHSYGEYVFDWAWAEAYRRHGLRYYPKLLGAVPFTPVAGTRLLAADEHWRAQLARAVHAQARSQVQSQVQSQVRGQGEGQTHALSSAHVIFTDEADARALAATGWMLRQGVQFHWKAPVASPWPDFDTYLASLQREKRKKIAQERRRVAEQGIRFTVHAGAQIDEPLWDFFHRCYTLTYEAHGGSPYLTRDFFAAMARTMAEHWVLFVARRGDDPVACSLIAVDPARRIAYGRYWGATEFISCLHFEACYYQPLAWCIGNGYVRFEGGAQGEHKMARGLLPVRTQSAHWLRDERFAQAVAQFLGAEGEHVEGYVDELRERNPFKARGEDDPG
jgi:predicted N-acyltransferase